MSDQDRVAEVVCPVCWGLLAPTGRCPTCGWPPPAPGPTAYRDAARAFDHAAAIRVAHARGHTGVPDDLAELVRFGPMRPGIAFPAAESAAPSGRAAALTLLTAMTAGELDMVLFLEIGTRHLSTQWVRLDDFGFVRASAQDRVRQEWRTVVPWLPKNVAARELTLAGGVGRRPALGTEQAPQALGPRARHMLRDNWGRALAELREGAADLAEQAWAFVLVERRPDWSWCALAAEIVHEALPPAAVLRGGPFAAEETALPLLVEQLALDVPVRHAVHLVSGDPRANEPGRERHDVLLGRGAIPGAEAAPLAEITLALRGEAGEGHDVALVVADSTHAHEWPEMARVKVIAPPGEVRFAIRMPAPGRVEFASGHGAAWEVAEEPAEFRPVAPAARGPVTQRPWWPREQTTCDLLCAVELGGEPDRTRARLDLVRALLLTAADPPNEDPRWGRACVVGYHDHPQPWRAGHDPLHRVDFTDPAAAREAIAEWTGSPIVDPYAAPLERVCALLRGNRLAWSSHRPTLVLTVGRRGPHPYVAGLDPARAHGGYRWDVDLMAYQAARPVRHMLVTDDPGYPRSLEPSARRRTMKAWHLLGASGCFTLGRSKPADLLRFGHVAATDAGGPPLLLDLVARPEADPAGPREDR
ncbi:hypothetical protein [Embleya scabrispora]|uniref:hypothetical protein n=1 Tax=Embleya scabrispora TaxID=159449 RepID=UPI00037243FD|nr:hypothetical protein [Embleya scabrispora]MYS83781.1 hypothetical protein [Streptomyces sp. SID5474]